VVSYELLTGRRPFIASTQNEDRALNELLVLIATNEPRAPRLTDDTIPRELKRMCLKALSKRASDRYSTARDLAEDLRLFIQAAGAMESPVGVVAPQTSRQSDSDQQPIRIVPKGLRSFDEHDAGFFLELLPGPRDLQGLPESIRFWKTRIESTDADKTFRVGLIYGPSGCGKSSQVEAGRLPLLGRHVLSVDVEATAGDMENSLLRGFSWGQRSVEQPAFPMVSIFLLADVSPAR
jgi:serine/threonine protein kinase